VGHDVVDLGVLKKETTGVSGLFRQNAQAPEDSMQVR